MNRFARLFIITSGLLFLLFFLLSLRSIVSLSRIAGEEAEAEVAAYHFAFFLPDEVQGFFPQVAAGAREAAAELDCALSFHPVGDGRLDLEMARFTGVDGVALYPSIDDDEARRILEDLNDRGISVVLVEHALSSESPWPFVGTNAFDIGKRIGELLTARPGERVAAALVYSEKSPGIYSEKDLVGLGITSTAGERLETPLSIRLTDLNPLDAEALVYGILRNEPEITTIVFTDSRDTLAATQVLIDMNLVGTVRLIGFGSDEAILDYVEKGVLAATVVTNPKGIGSGAVEMLMEMRRVGNAPAYVDTGVQVVTAANVEAFRRGEGDE